MNNIKLAGEICTDVKVRGELYSFYMKIQRISGIYDTVLCVTDNPENYKNGDKVTIEGAVRTKNDKKDGKMHLIIYVFVEKFSIYLGSDFNDVYLDGFICKEPIYRITPKEKRITEVIVASNRVNNKSDYIPCILWNRNAEMVKDAAVGTEIEILGRLQSREYIKAFPDGTSENKTAYEISCENITLYERKVEDDR